MEAQVGILTEVPKKCPDYTEKKKEKEIQERKNNKIK